MNIHHHRQVSLQRIWHEHIRYWRRWKNVR
jgi:hypothetical protein